MLIKGSQSQIKEFFKDMSIFLILGLLFNIPIFFFGMYTDSFYDDILQPILYLVLVCLGLICMMKIFISAKRHKYKNVSSLINVSILSSFLAAFQFYCLLFCFVYLIMNSIEDREKYPLIEIIAGLLYFVIGIVIMTFFRDIFFVIAMVIIENGLLYSKRNHKLLATVIVNFFNFS